MTDSKNSLTQAFRSTQNALREFSKRMAEISRRTDWAEIEEITKRMRAAKDNPDDRKSKIWETAIGRITPREASLFWRYLPDPLKRRGRPKGGELANDDAFFEAMEARIKTTGKAAKTVARELIVERGGVDYAEVESRVNYVARLYRQRVKK